MRSCKRYSKRKISALLGAVRQEHAHFRKVERGELDESASFCQSCADLSAVVRQLRRELAIRQETVEALNVERKRQAAEVQRLRHELAERMYATTWRSIASAPKDGTIILGFDPNYGRIGMWWGRGEWISTVDADPSMPIAPTHWMPLPPAPEVKS